MALPRRVDASWAPPPASAGATFGWSTPPRSARSDTAARSLAGGAYLRLTCRCAARASHRRLVVRVEEVLRVVLELEQAALAAEPVGGALVLERESGGRRCRPPSRRRDRSRWPSVPPRSVLARSIRGRRTDRAVRSATTPPTVDADPRAPLDAERDRLRRGARRGHRRARPDDLRLAGRRGEPGLRAAARPRPARPGRAAARARSTAALARLDDGTFGTCVRCGRPIAPTGSRPSRGPPTASTASGSSAATLTDASTADRAGLVTIDDDPRRRATPARASRSGRRSCRSGRRRPALPQGRVAPADRRVQDPRRLRRGRLAAARGARPRRHHLLVGQPRPGRRPRRAAARRPGRRRHAVRRAGDQARAGRGRRRRDRHRRHGQRRAPGGRRAIAAERGLAIIPPYDDDRIIAGQGTVGLEIVEDLPDLAAVLVPIGGGGLASGVAVGGPGARARTRG